MTKIKIMVCLVVLFMCQQTVQAQYILKMTDEDCVSLSVDVLRKGIQQQRVGAVLRVIGSAVLVQGAGEKPEGSVTQMFEEIFANSSGRERVEGDKAMPRSGPVMQSDLWDFDILSPQITVKGDSAYVECELVLWEAIPTGSARVGSKTAEKLVFWSPAKYQPENTLSVDPLRWQLVECDNLFDFLTSYGAKSTQKDESDGGEK